MCIQEKQITTLEKIRRTLVDCTNQGVDCIDLWAVQQLRKNKYEECKKARKRLEEQMRNVLKAKYGADASVRISRCDYASGALNLEIDVYYDSVVAETIAFAIKKDHISICDAPATKIFSHISLREISGVESRASDILKLLGKLLLEFYDSLVFEAQGYQEICNINSTDSNFLVAINLQKLEICFDNDLKLAFQDSIEQPKYDFEYYDSYKVLEAIRGQENEIFKRIFVKIEDCPEWMRSDLYISRQSRLTVKQKVIEFIRKKFNA